MKILSLRETQSRALQLLVKIDKICRKNNIRYSLFYGTLIGLERHRGFIPWDDDIDIVLRRADYEHLVSLLSDNMDVTILSQQTCAHFRYPFTKVVDPNTTLTTNQFYDAEDERMGVFIDIFPIDGIPDNQLAQKAFHDECEQYRLNMMDTLPGHSYARSFSRVKSLVKRVIRYPHYLQLMRQGDDSYWRCLYETAAIRYPLQQSKYCGYLEWIDRKWGVFPTEWFADDQYEDVNFSGYRLMAIKSRRDFLRLRFGNYMRLPPVSEQITHHPYTFMTKK